MKKALFCSAILSLFGSPVFAYISGKVSVEEKIIFCPFIKCTKAGDPNSCGINKSNNPEYWDIASHDLIQVGQYTLSRVDSSYHSRGPSNAICRYSIKSTHGVERVYNMVVSSKPESNLEAYHGPNTAWNIGACLANHPYLCPLKEKSGVGLSFKALKGDREFKLDFSIYGINIISGLMPGQSAFISYEEAMNCWSNKTCNIDVFLTRNGQKTSVGTLKVDMDNKMKIVQPIPSSDQDFFFRVLEPFNSFQAEKVKDVIPSSPIVIYTTTNFGMNVSVGGVIIAELDKNRVANLNYETVKKICGITKKCSIDLATVTGAEVGSLDVNVENDMTILSVHSVHPSEISVSKTDSHRIDISYLCR